MNRRRYDVPKYLIKRDIPNAGAMTHDELEGAARASCAVLSELGPEVQWVHSYVTADTIHCVYIAPDEGLIRVHADRAGFPANEIMEIEATIDPTTAEA